MLTNEQAVALLSAQLAKVEPEIIKPLATYTWTRDLPEGNDLDRTMDSLVLTKIVNGAGQGTTKMEGKSWIAKNGNDLKDVAFDMSAEAVRVFDAGRELSWTARELERAQIYGLSLDTEKVEILHDIFNQEAQATGYLGDADFGFTGLLNNAEIAKAAVKGKGLLEAANDVSALVKAYDNAMRAAEERADEVVMPTRLLVCPADYVMMHAIKIDVSNTNTVSLIEYLEKHSYAAISGVDFKVEKVRECKGLASSQKNRQVLYTPDRKYLKYNVMPMWREKVYDKGLQYCSAYLWRIAELQLRQAQTITYLDNI